MATESPIRFVETSGKWASKGTYEDLGLVIKGQNFPENQRNLGLNRSGSAPPSMEGSFAAIENLMSRHKTVANASESEEQLRADPSYFAYYSTHVNLNPRLPPPLISDQNRYLVRNVATTANNPRFNSFDDSTRSTQSNLSTHKEEFDDDESTKQENSPNNAEADNHDGDNIGQVLYSNSTTTAISNSSEDDVSTSADVSSITNDMVAINMSNILNIESQSQQDRQQKSMLQVNVPHPQIVSQGQTYIGMNQYLPNPNFSSEVQRALHSSGLTPPTYASGSTYMMSPNHVNTNMYFPQQYAPQQYTVGGYAFNPPYVSGYLHMGPIQMPFDIHSLPNYIGQGQGQNQHLNKFYGHPGLPMQPPFAESLQLSSHGDDPIQKQQPLGNVGHNLNPRRIDTTSPYNLGSPTNMGILQFPNTSYACPPVPGSPIGGPSFKEMG